MKKILSNKITLFLILAITILFLVFYIYMLARPISYGMEYSIADDVNFKVDGEEQSAYFESTTVFHNNNKVSIKNSNFDETIEYYYFYKDGYVVTCTAKNDAEYKAEVEEIQANWDNLIKDELYVSKINAFNLSSVSDDIDMVQKCNDMITFSILAGILEVILIALTVTCFIFNKKSKINN